MLRDLQIIIICFITGLQLLASALLYNCRPYSFQFLASLQCTSCEASDPVSRRSILISTVVCKYRQCGMPHHTPSLLRGAHSVSVTGHFAAEPKLSGKCSGFTHVPRRPCQFEFAFRILCVLIQSGLQPLFLSLCAASLLNKLVISVSFPNLRLFKIKELVCQLSCLPN